MGKRPTKEAHSGLSRLPSTASAADGVGPVQDEHFHAARPRGFHAVGQGVDERVDPGARILEIDQQDVDVGEHLPTGDAGVPVQAEDRQAQRRIDQVAGLDHVVLFFREKPVLRGKERAQGAGKPLVDQLPGVPQPAVDRRGVAEQTKPKASSSRRADRQAGIRGRCGRGS